MRTASLVMVWAMVLSGCASANEPAPTVDASVDDARADGGGTDSGSSARPDAPSPPDTTSEAADAAADGEASDVAGDAVDAAEPLDTRRCHELAVEGSGVTVKNSTAAPPAATGGTIVDGTYVISESIHYGPSPVSELDMATLKFEGGTLYRIDDWWVSTQSYELAGTSLKYTAVCGTFPTWTIPFDATATTYREYLPMGTGTRVRTYTRK